MIQQYVNIKTGTINIGNLNNKAIPKAGIIPDINPNINIITKIL